MPRSIVIFLAGGLLGPLLGAASLAAPAAAPGGVPLGRYEVTSANTNPGQNFSPPVLVVHRPAYELFEVGQPASEALWQLAEEGATAAFEALDDPVARCDALAHQRRLCCHPGLDAAGRRIDPSKRTLVRLQPSTGADQSPFH